ncbi:MAG TPA: HEAT repeat domain-containing protein [Gaiellaceae bacterium]|jgi:hypothetical protein
MAGRRQVALTPKVRDLVATDRQSRPPVGRLTAAQVEQLVAVAQRKQQFDLRVSAARAVTALASGAAPRVAVPVLDTVLADAGAPRTDRIAAARGLGTIATPEAERRLLRHVRDPDPRVQQDVLAALGTFAGLAAARALDQVEVPSDRFARQQLAFTRALVAHREGLPGPFLTEARPVERSPGRASEMSPLTLRVGTANATAAAAARLRGPRYGIAFADRAFALSCGPAEWTIFLNRSLVFSGRGPANLFERPWVAAVLAQALPGREALTTRFVLLTRPTGRDAHVDVVRADGEILYTGTVRPAGAATAFAISDVERPATAPFTVTGRATATRITVETAVVFSSRVGVRETLSALA